MIVLGGISLFAYQAGVHNADETVSAVTVAGGAAAGETGIVIVRDRGWGGFHPFGFFFLMLIRGLLFGAFFRARHGGGWGGGPGGGRGRWGAHARQVHDEWHRSGDAASTGGPSADAGAAR